jgi:hypothetical protein
MEYDREYGPPDAIHHVMESEECDRHNVEDRRRTTYEADYGHPKVVSPNLDRQPRSKVVVPAWSRGNAQDGGGVDDIAITAFPVLLPPTHVGGLP